MIGKYRGGIVPDADPAPEIAMQFDGLAATVRQRIDRVEVSAALEDVWERVRALNRYVTESEPWQLAKDDGAAVELDVVLYTLAEGLRVVSVLLHPWMPESAERLLAALGREDLSLEAAQLGAVAGGATLGELGQLFPRVEPRAEAPA
jgi:methionyl-tRNA synthetase